MDIVLQGSGQNSSVEAQVDPTQQSIRANLRPLEHVGYGVVGGHYQMVATYSNTAAKPTTNADIFSLRWFATNLLFVLKRLTLTVSTTTAYTAAANQDAALFRATGFSVAASGGTQIIPSSASQRMREANMAASQLNGSGGVLWVSSGDALTAGTRTLDTQPMGYFSWLNSNSINAPSVGVLEEMRDFGEHPLILAANEGIVIETPIGNAQAAGVSKFAFTMEWAEVPAY